MPTRAVSQSGSCYAGSHYARSGEPFTFPLLIESRYETNGGYMMDVVVTYDEKNTQHRVILGRDYYDAVGVSPDEFTVEMFRWLVAHKAPLHTEGTLEIDDFPVNYFSSSQLIQRWPDFADVFDAKPLKGFGPKKVDAFAAKSPRPTR